MKNITFFAELQRTVDFSQLNAADPEQFEHLFAWVLQENYDLYDLGFVIQIMQQPPYIFEQYIRHLAQRLQQINGKKSYYVLKEIQGSLQHFEQQISRWHNRQHYSIQALVMGKQLYQYHCKVRTLEQQRQKKPAWFTVLLQTLCGGQ